jgi:peroxiredoxin
VRRHYEDIRRAGGEVVAVFLARPETLKAQLDREPLPFAAVADPDLSAYRAMGLVRMSIFGFASPRVVYGYAKRALEGYGLVKPNPEEDVYQLGGDFVLDRNGEIVYAHRSRDPTDRPPIEDLLRAVRTAAR